ncbi:MAG: efflux RND transporter permease subunit, partial [Verrucomicrobia bacterium]|nr:efflux RND transporter permease subunit [Verrucomicrobiota bacterium]
MIDSILEFSMRQRAFVLLAAAALLGAGLWSALHLPMDAVPDITGIQVQINTEVPALAAEESEKLVTLPIERELAGLPGVDAMRSLTKFGLSQITLDFADSRIEYFLRCPFSQARMIDVTQEGKVLYKSGHNRMNRFPEPASEDLLAGPKRNFQVFDPLDFLAEVTQHVPDPGEHLIRYYGWYSNKNRGRRAKTQKEGRLSASLSGIKARSSKDCSARSAH